MELSQDNGKFRVRTLIRALRSSRTGIGLTLAIMALIIVVLALVPAINPGKTQIVSDKANTNHYGTLEDYNLLGIITFEEIDQETMFVVMAGIAIIGVLVIALFMATVVYLLNYLTENAKKIPARSAEQNT